MQTLVLASHNKGKVAELKALLESFPVRVQGLDAYPGIGEIPETGETFEENAAIKAEAVCRLTGRIALADDSGLAVDFLGGAPGVYSARYSDPGATPERNNEKLLRELSDVPRDKRTARFICVMTAQAPCGETLTARGEWPGVIAETLQGQGGFGYDPVFFDPEAGMTAAQMEPAFKNQRSHRGLALRALLEGWKEFLDRVRAD
ncbi:MAG: XTP/dITP diphosphatase [Desulfovibrio sp.]|nr:MAG: XTP/dITP diphosphatase [Desulfovibrio sp.]